METILEKINEWLTLALNTISATLLNHSFDGLNDILQFGIGQITETPATFGGGTILSLVQGISTNVILPVAGLILTYSFVYNMIALMTERNHMAEIEWFHLFKELFKTACCVMLVTNCFTITMAFFDLGTWLVNTAGGNVTVFLDKGSIVDALTSTTDFGPALANVLFSFVACFIILICAGLILATIWSRLISIYILIALAPIPMATFMQSEWIGAIGQNFIKTLLGYALQGLVIYVLVRIMGMLFSAVAPTIIGTGDITGLVKIVVLTGVCTGTILRSLSLSKSVLNAM
ncbi:MAG: CD0415/CD1112 family protein [Erysipelotrichaceae bacterium]|nr:CD0415/CD1112 family protein [Erysipelotrichaceae bacterium]